MIDSSLKNKERAQLEFSCHQLGVQRAQRRVLQDINCTFKPFELTAIIGPNGAGKSSFLETLAGVLPPHSGHIQLGEHNARTISSAARARLSAYLPQAESPAWSLSGEDLVALGLLPWGRPADRRERIIAALTKVDAMDLATRPVTGLSGGELRRVQLARLLVGDAPLLIADEPTAALDMRHQLQLMHTFRQQADAGKTVILALHDLTLAARFCDRIVLLQNGNLCAQGSPRDVLTPALIGDVYGVSSEFRWRGERAEFMLLDLLDE